MTQQNITIQPNLVTPVSMALAGGATLHNADDENAIWVAANPGVAPGAGMRIGPKGSLSWTSDKVPCYACVDSGVTSGIQLSVSTDIANLVNPIDVGIAVATALAVQGVPNVLVGDLVYDDDIPAFTTSITLPFDTSRYANLTVQLYSFGVAQHYILEQQDVATGTPIQTMQLVDQAGTIFTAPLTTDVTVRGDRVNIYRSDATGLTNVKVYASNRVISENIMRYRYPYTSSIMAHSFTAATKVTFGTDMRSQGGQYYVRLVATGTLTGYLGFRYIGAGGTVTTYDLLDTANGHVGPDGKEIQTMIQLPPGIFELYFDPRVTTVADVVLTMVPA